MKKILSLILCVSIVFATLCMAGVPSFAIGNIVAKDYVQKHVRAFADFVKARGTYRDGYNCYVYTEDEFYQAEEGILASNAYLYFQEEDVVLMCDLTSESPRMKCTLMLSIPYTYNTQANVLFRFAYLDSDDTFMATSFIDIPNYNGKNATFYCDLDIPDEEDYAAFNKACNGLLNSALMLLDEGLTANQWSPCNIPNFGFCNYCAHSMMIRPDPATTAQNGCSNSKICRYCGLYQKGTNTVYKIASIQLSKTAFYYNGKVQTPKVTVKDTKGKVLKEKIDYTIALSKGRKAVGKYAVVVTFKGNYSGKKTLYYTINPTKTAIKKLTPAKKAMGVQWNKVGGVSGYQIQYSTKANFSGAKTVNVKGATTLSKKLTGLGSGKACYVRIRTYKATTFSGQKVYVYSGWCAVKNAKAK